MTQYYNVSLQKLNNHAPHFCITTERRLDDHIVGVVYSMI